jgi:hypothetical protein
MIHGNSSRPDRSMLRSYRCEMRGIRIWVDPRKSILGDSTKPVFQVYPFNSKKYAYGEGTTILNNKQGFFYPVQKGKLIIVDCSKHFTVWSKKMRISNHIFH